MTRRFSSAPLPLDRVVALCDLARRAPSAGFSQGTHLLVLSGDERAALWEGTGAGAWFASRSPGVLDAPVLVLALADQRAYEARYAGDDKTGHGLEVGEGWPTPFWLTDTAMAVQNLLLLVQAEGWGALWFGVFRQQRALLDALGVPEGVHLVGVVAVGARAPDDAPSGSPTRRSRRAAPEVVHVGRWAQPPDA